MDADEQGEGNVNNVVGASVSFPQSVLPTKDALPLLLTGVGMMPPGEAHRPMFSWRADTSDLGIWKAAAVGATDHVEDAKFLWREGRRGSALLLVCVGVAARARREYPGDRDGDAFARLVANHLSGSISVEFREELWPIERLL